jgi:hypothetical protein
MSTKNSENTCVVQGKEYEAVPTKNYTASCSGCAFYRLFTSCGEAGKCASSQRKDEQNIIWVLKEKK